MKRFKFIQLALSLSILIYLFVRFNYDQFSLDQLKITSGSLTFIILLLFVSLIVRAYRWKILLYDNNSLEISLFDSMRLLLIGLFLNIFFPANTGDLGKCYFAYKWSGVKEKLFSVSICDKTIALASLSALGLISFALTKQYGYFLACALSIVPLCIMMLLVRYESLHFIRHLIEVANRRIQSFDLNELIKNMKTGIRTLSFCFAISIIGWFLTYYLLYFCFRFEGTGIPLHIVIAIGPLLSLGRLFPFTFNGIGSDEALIVYLFSGYGMGSDQLLVSALSYRFFFTLIPAFLGFLIMIATNRMNIREKLCDEKCGVI